MSLSGVRGRSNGGFVDGVTIGVLHRVDNLNRQREGSSRGPDVTGLQPPIGGWVESCGLCCASRRQQSPTGDCARGNEALESKVAWIILFARKAIVVYFDCKSSKGQRGNILDPWLLSDIPWDRNRFSDEHHRQDASRV